MRVITIAAAIASSYPIMVAAKPLNQDQKNALAHYAMVSIIAERCSSLRWNTPRIVLYLDRQGVDARDLTPEGKLFPELLPIMKSLIDKTDALDREKVCDTGDALYGPDGIAAKGLLVKR